MSALLDSPATPSSPRRRAAALALLLLLALVPLATAADDWPQWRGADGSGVNDTAELPTTWSDEGDGIAWRTPLPGHGVSSPVVVGDRVFVTTAYRAGIFEAIDRWRPAATVVLVALMALFLAARVRPQGGLGAIFRRPLSGDALVTLAATLLFLLLALLLAVRPDLYLEEGNPGRAWRISSLVALLGAGAAVGWCPGGSRGRRWGTVALLAAGVLVAALYPHGPKGSVDLLRRLVAAFPAIALPIWWAVHRRRRSRGAATVHTSFYRPELALGLLVVALAVFVPLNYLKGLERAIVAVDLGSGEILWQRSVLRAPTEQKYPKSSYATPTPVADSERVYAYFGAGAGAVDHDGRLLWTRRYPDYTPHTRYGASSSPIRTPAGLLIVQESELYQGGPPSWIELLDTATGEPIWRIEPPEAHDTYATPISRPTGEGDQLLLATWGAYIGFDLATGERLWDRPHIMQQIVASFAVEDDILATTGGAHGEKTLDVFRILPGGAGLEPLWQSRRGVATIASPVIYGQRLFTVTDTGVMTCYDALTGDTLWRGRLDGNFYASLVAGDGKVYAVNTEGETSVIAAGDEFRVLAVNPAGGEVYSSPAIADGGLLLRTDRELVRIEGAESPASAVVGEPVLSEAEQEAVDG